MRSLSMIPLPLRIVAGILAAVLVSKIVGGAAGSWMFIVAIVMWVIVLSTIAYELGWLNALSKVPGLSNFLSFMASRDKISAASPAETGDSGPRGKLDDEDRQKLLAEAQAKLNRLSGLEDVRAQISERLIAPVDEDPSNPFATQAPALLAIFAGPAGTGKTTAAISTAQILAGKGVLQTANIVTLREIDLRSGGHSSPAQLAEAKAKEAIDGTLLLENAGWLLEADPYGGQGPGGDFGQAILDVVSRNKHRIFLAATMSAEEAERLPRDPAIARWMSKLTTRTIHFEDLPEAALLDLLEARINDNGWALLDDEAARAARRLMISAQERAEAFDNAEACRRVAEALVETARREAEASDRDDRVITKKIVQIVDDYWE